MRLSEIIPLQRIVFGCTDYQTSRRRFRSSRQASSVGRRSGGERSFGQRVLDPSVGIIRYGVYASTFVRKGTLVM